MLDVVAWAVRVVYGVTDLKRTSSRSPRLRRP